MKTLLPHQKKILAYTYRVKHPALFLDMRLGKTVITVRRVNAYSDCSKVLVVCPYSAFLSWEEEIQESGQTYCTLIGDTKVREKLLNDNYVKCKWFILNKEGHQQLPDIAKLDWDVVILDESTFIKSIDTATTKFYIQNFRQAKHRWILAGIPNPESDLDYFSQFLFLDNGETFKTSNYYQFRFKYFRQLQNEWFTSPMGNIFIAERLHGRAYFMSRKEVRNTIEKTYICRKVEMSTKLKKQYLKVEKDFMLDLPDGDILSTIFATEKYIWLRSMASGFLPEGTLVCDCKVKELLYLLSTEFKNQQVIVWASRTHEIDYLKTLLPDCRVVNGSVSKKKRFEIEKDFKGGKFKVFLANPECYKFGANLSHADTMIYFSNCDPLLTRSQSEDRIVNLNKSSASLIIDLVTEKTVDEDLLDTLKEKKIKSTFIRALVKRMEERHGQIKK